jgi:hypothetical protein
MLNNQTGSYNDLQNKFIIDTGSTIGATVMNPDFVTNIRESNNPIVMKTNAGTKKMKNDGDIIGFGVAKYDNTQMANIFGFSHMTDKHRITYDNQTEDAFLVHTDDGIIKFARDGRLYSYKPSQNYLDTVAKSNGLGKKRQARTIKGNFSKIRVSHLNTVAGNRAGFTKCQVDDAKRARRL